MKEKEVKQMKMNGRSKDDLDDIESGVINAMKRFFDSKRKGKE